MDESLLDDDGKLENTRLTDAQCTYAIKMCKEARPMAEAPGIKLFPYCAMACPCCFCKERKTQKTDNIKGKVGDGMLRQLSSTFKGLNASTEQKQSFASKL
jgi:hypothetical protein